MNEADMKVRDIWMHHLPIHTLSHRTEYIL